LQANKDGRDRIIQIDNVIHEAIEGIKSVEDKSQSDIDLILDKYTEKFKSLQDDSFQKLSDAIDHAECAADKTLTQYLQDALGAFGRLINTNSFVLSPPPLYVGEQDCGIIRGLSACHPIEKTFTISSANPAATEKALRDYMEARLAQTRDDTPISSILISYNIIANFANRTGCLTHLHEAYASIAEPYMAKIKLWQQVTGENEVPVPQ
jgi:hypothetical protein